MPDEPKLDDSAAGFTEGSIKAELKRVLESAAFNNVDRLKAFLSYVVTESLAGRGDLIAGKTIAHDVYGRASVDGSDSIVRVDAGRLRRKLSEYYENEGFDNPIRIHIDSGGYAPRFESKEIENDPQTRSDVHQITKVRPQGALPWLLASGFGAAVGAVLIYWQMSSPESPATDFSARNQSERSALAEKSTATLQAANLAEQASGLLFPIANVKYQKLATSMYREAIQIDPNFPDALAGAAHSLGTLALLAPDADTRMALLGEAQGYAQKAANLAPLSGWAQSAVAWVAFASGEYERAVDISRRAISLDEVDSKTLDFSGVIFGMTGHFAESAKVSDPSRSRNSKTRGPAHLNIYGVASFHLGNYEEAISAIDEAVTQGGPVSALTLVFKAAALQAIGDKISAAALLEQLQTTWPDFSPRNVLERFYQHPQHSEDLLGLLQEAGWPAGQ